MQQNIVQLKPICRV